MRRIEKYIFAGLLGILFFACTKEEIKPQINLDGKWQFNNYFLIRETAGSMPEQATVTAPPINRIEFFNDGTVATEKLTMQYNYWRFTGNLFSTGTYRMVDNTLEIQLYLDGKSTYKKYEIRENESGKLEFFEDKNLALSSLEKNISSITKEQYTREKELLSTYSKYEVTYSLEKVENSTSLVY